MQKCFFTVLRTCGNIFTSLGSQKRKRLVYFKDKKGYKAHAVNLFRPLALRLFMTFLPPAVAFLARKPCFRFPFNFVGVFKFFFIDKILAYIRAVSM